MKAVIELDDFWQTYRVSTPHAVTGGLGDLDAALRAVDRNLYGERRGQVHRVGTTAMGTTLHHVELGGVDTSQMAV